MAFSNGCLSSTPIENGSVEVIDEENESNKNESPDRECKMEEIQSNLTHYLKKKDSHEDLTDEEPKKDSPRDVNHPA